MPQGGTLSDCRLVQFQSAGSKHGVPHFHAIYGEYNGVFNLKTLEMIEGDMPARAMKMVKDWAKKYNNDLMEMWKTQKYRQLPGLE